VIRGKDAIWTILNLKRMMNQVETASETVQQTAGHCHMPFSVILKIKPAVESHSTAGFIFNKRGAAGSFQID
jgi:hypothetical protein